MKRFTVARIVSTWFKQIEKMVYEGMTQMGIVEIFNAELEDSGSATTVENFRNELHRARKKRKAIGLHKTALSTLPSNLNTDQMTKNLSKLETKEKPTEKLASSGELNFSAKHQNKSVRRNSER